MDTKDHQARKFTFSFPSSLRRKDQNASLDDATAYLSKKLSIIRDGQSAQRPSSNSPFQPRLSSDTLLPIIPEPVKFTKPGKSQSFKDRWGPEYDYASGRSRTHPFFDGNAPKVVLLSGDGHRFCVDKQILRKNSTVFGDMFSLPEADAPHGSWSNEPIFLDEPADVIANVLNELYVDRHRHRAYDHDDIKNLHAAVKFHDKYGIETTRESTIFALHMALRSDPFAGLAYASRQNDLEFGREAVAHIRLGTGQQGEVDLWALMADIKPSWQVALAKLMIPRGMYHYEHPGSPGSNFGWSHRNIDLDIPGADLVNMKLIADQFDPRDD